MFVGVGVLVGVAVGIGANVAVGRGVLVGCGGSVGLIGSSGGGTGGRLPPQVALHVQVHGHQLLHACLHCEPTGPSHTTCPQQSANTG